MTVHRATRGARRGTALLALAAVPALVPAATHAGPTADTPTAPCTGADTVTVDSKTKRETVAALRCLIDRSRAEEERDPLKRSRVLDRVAERHSRELQRRDVLTHTDARGRNLKERLRAAGYPRGRRSFSASETVSWGSGDRRSAAALIGALRDSRANRARLLRAGSTELGVGVSTGIPVKGKRGRGVTLTLIVARR